MVAKVLRGSQPRSRPLYTTLFILSLLTAYSFLIHIYGAKSSVLEQHQHGDGKILEGRSLPLSAHECRDVHRAKDQCSFIKKYCHDENAGLLPYLELYYCTLERAQPLAFIILTLWLGLLFTTIGIAASDFFSINLSTISTILGLSESLAGVTFLAFGNGSPDVFSTFAAMGSNSASMAVGELIGAACFITAVVAGSMSLVREFRVERKTYVRDICFFIVAVLFTTLFLIDGNLYFWECCVMIAYYALYVMVVVGWHWYSTTRKRRQRREGEARSHFYGASTGTSSDDLAGQPYQDDPDDATSSRNDLSMLENGPRIEIDGHEADLDSIIDDEDDVDEHDRIVAAEVSRGMRVLRPSGRRSTTITPIRPSLVGALEFRSALAQLQRESNLQLGVLGGGRSRSETHVFQQRPRRGSTSALNNHHVHHTDSHLLTAGGTLSGRERASTATYPPISASAPKILTSPDEYFSQDARHSQFKDNLQEPSPLLLGADLVPPTLNLPSPLIDPTQLAKQQRPRLHLQTPSITSSFGSNASSPTSPFPQYTDSPLLLTPHFRPEQPSYGTSTPTSVRRDTTLTVPASVGCQPKPVHWWPYSLLPHPHVLLSTLFPTLQGWHDKSYWDKLISTLSIPSIFLLVITLPVVEHDADEGMCGGNDTIADYSSRRNTGQSATPLTIGSAQLAALEREETLVTSEQGNGMHHHHSAQGLSKSGPASPTFSDELHSAFTWNRWLVGVQLFTGPLFAIFVLWANIKGDMKNPGRELIQMVLYTLVGSLVALAALLLFTVEHCKPRYHFFLCFLGFVISIAWISTIAGEVVGVLKTFGVVLDISEALLGLTIFAAGNSVGDLVADITVAKLGYPVMALSACFGGPLLNILLGIGIGGIIMMVKETNRQRQKNPELSYHYGPYPVKVGGTLLISSISLLMILIGLLVAVPMNNWILSRKIGWSLIAMWTISTIVSISVELTGTWEEI